MATLTKRQKQLIDYLNNYISEHGYAPTLAEVGQYFGLSSLAIGSILSTALLVGPAATALRLTRRVGVAIIGAVGIGVGLRLG